MEVFYDFRTHCIHDIADQSDPGCDRNGLIHERKVIANGVLPRYFSGPFHANNVVASLGKAHKKCDKESHKHNPFAQKYMGREASGKQTEHETKGNNAHIYNGILL